MQLWSNKEVAINVKNYVKCRISKSKVCLFVALFMQFLFQSFAFDVNLLNAFQHNTVFVAFFQNLQLYAIKRYSVQNLSFSIEQK